MDGFDFTRLTSHGTIAPTKPELSPDKTMLVYVRRPSLDLADGGHSIERMSRNGEGVTEVIGATPGRFFALPRFSPDGKQLMFTSYSKQILDSSQIYLTPTDGTGQQQLITMGTFGAFWINNTTIGVDRSSGTWLVDLTTKVERKFSADSLHVTPVLNAAYFVYNKGSRWWLKKINQNWKSASGAADKLLMDLQGTGSRAYAANDALYYVDRENRIWRKAYLDGSLKQIPGVTKGMSPKNISVSPDGKEMLFNNELQDTKLVLVEGLFVK
jgi:dipeptidyl aminopeptidase/acylaminoacyl peptidase